MKKATRPILFLLLVIGLLAISTSVVFAKELGLLTISGPGIKGEVSLNDHEVMMDLEQSGFFDQAILSKLPKGLGEGYNITAHLNLDGKSVPFIQMVYYPTNEGQSAYVHYTGRLEGETLQSVDEWHMLNPKADSVLRDVMMANNITVQSALIKAPEVAAPAQEAVEVPALESVAAPVASPASTPTAYLIPLLIVGILALSGIALVVRRRTVSHPVS